jgi:hypothetical protein
LPGDPNDGIVIKHQYFGETGTAANNNVNTLVHEFGHYAYLYHVWGSANGECHANSDCLTKGDRVCDTPPCLLSPSNCISNSCSTDVPDLNDPRENYMSYSHSCQFRFTEGQAVRMKEMALNFSRAGLWSDENKICTGISGFYAGNNPTLTAPVTNWTTTSLLSYSDIVVSGTLTVESGSTLNIGSGMTVHFCNNGKLVIKPNAIVNLSGTLTNNCDISNWKGVEV